MAGLRPIPSGPPGTEEARPASDIVGVSPTGLRIEIRLDEFVGPLLLAFLHTKCDGCEEFWRGFRDDAVDELPPSVSAVVVTRGPGSVAPDDVERAAAGVGRVPVIMSEDAWSEYRVLGYPFFVLVDVTSHTVIAETVGFGWSDLISMIRSAGY
jgi:hypothetical protein